MQTETEEQHIKQHRKKHVPQQQPHQQQQQQAVPFELSPIPRPGALFATSTPTLAEEIPGGKIPGSQPGAAAADPTLPSPASAVASLTRDLEQSLSLQLAMRGQFVVKPQVTCDRHYRKLSARVGPLNGSTHQCSSSGYMSSTLVGDSVALLKITQISTKK